MGSLVLTERYEAYAARIQLPLSIQTSSAKLKVTTDEELHDGFDEFVTMMRSLGVTDIIRKVHNARFQGNDHIVGIYDTKLMDGPRQVRPTFHSKMCIGRYDGIWKAIKINNTTNDARWPMLLTRLDATHSLPEEM
jgi:hypothetical protein